MDEIEREQLIDRITASSKTPAMLFQHVIDLIREIRTIRGQNNVPGRAIIDVTLDNLDKDELRVTHEYKEFIERMAKCRLYFAQKE